MAILIVVSIEFCETRTSHSTYLGYGGQNTGHTGYGIVLTFHVGMQTRTLRVLLSNQRITRNTSSVIPIGEPESNLTGCQGSWAF